MSTNSKDGTDGEAGARHGRFGFKKANRSTTASVNHFDLPAGRAPDSGCDQLMIHIKKGDLHVVADSIDRLNVLYEEPFRLYRKETNSRVLQANHSPYGSATFLHAACSATYTVAAKKRTPVPESTKLLLVNLLLEKGIGRLINKPDEFGRTPLWIATSARYWQIASTLLDAGANPNQISLPYGTAPVHLMVEQSSVPRGILGAFMNAGANMDLWTKRTERTEQDLRYVEPSTLGPVMSQASKDRTAGFMLTLKGKEDLNAEYLAWKARDTLKRVGRLASLTNLKPL